MLRPPRFLSNIGRRFGIGADVGGSEPALADDQPKWRVTCHMPAGYATPGAVTNEAPIIAVSGYLDRLAYLRIAGLAAEIIESGAGSAGVTVDSDGGSLYGLDGAVASLVELRNHLRGELWTLNVGHANSAACALLLCAGPGRVCATAGTQAGGLGAIMRIEDNSRLWDEAMLTTAHMITAGRPLKYIGAPGVPVTQEQLDFQGAQVAEADRAFLSLCAAARGVDPREMARVAGRGGVYTATEARRLGLIDQIINEHEWKFHVVSASSGVTQETTMSQPFQAPQPAQGWPAPAAPQQTAQSPQPVQQPLAPVSQWPPPQQIQPAQPAQAAAPGAGQPQSVPTPQPAPAAPAWPQPISQPTAQPDRLAQIENVLGAVTASMAQIGAAVAQITGHLGQGQLEARLAPYRQRLQACAGGKIRADQVEPLMASVKALVEAGQDPEGLLQAYERLPDATTADVNAEITFAPIQGQAPQTQPVDLSRFMVPGANGQGVLDSRTQQQALQVLGAIAQAPQGQEWAALENLRKNGYGAN